MRSPKTLWAPAEAPDPRMMAYTIGDDRVLDARLLRWDAIGSLGHIEALARGGIIDEKERRRMRGALLAALRAVDLGQLTITAQDEDCHSALEFWLTRHAGDVGQRIHTGRSRNDQVAVDLRLYLKDTTLELHRQMLSVVESILTFGHRHRTVLWPGYTHQRIAMPSSAGLWATGLAECLLDAADGVAGFWSALDRSPLGSAAGYGVPLPLDREAAARALGFAGIDQAVTTTQGGRGQLEAQVLFWCAGAAQQCAKLACDVILFSADEFGWLVLPSRWSTGSSIMPQKRNPDLFELTRARAASIEGDLAAVLGIRAKLASGYHRDFQLLKAPLWRGLDSTSAMLGVLAAVIPELDVDRARAKASLRGEVFATDEVMRRVRSGTAFRVAYREVAAGIHRGDVLREQAASAVVAARTTSGGLGNLAFAPLRRRMRASRRWHDAERRRFVRAIGALVATRPGKGGGRGGTGGGLGRQ